MKSEKYWEIHFRLEKNYLLLSYVYISSFLGHFKKNNEVEMVGTGFCGLKTPRWSTNVLLFGAS